LPTLFIYLFYFKSGNLQKATSSVILLRNVRHVWICRMRLKSFMHSGEHVRSYSLRHVYAYL